MAAKEKLAEQDMAEELYAESGSKNMLLIQTTYSRQTACALDHLHL
jgi:hypothetical protein